MPTRGSIEELWRCFIALKRTIESSCDSEPAVLIAAAQDDNSLRDKCTELDRLADKLRQHEAVAERGLISPVDATFRKEWKNYNSNWRKPISDVVMNSKWPDMAELFAGIGKIAIIDDNRSEAERSRAEEMLLKYLIRDLKKIHDVADAGSDEQEAITELIRSMIVLWKTTNFSMPGADQRAAQAPVLLVSKKISDRITPGDRLSLYGYWNEARRSYILGASMASIAMSRATLEVLRKNVLKAGGEGLSGDLMDRIQRSGNAILHALKDCAGIPEKRATTNPTVAALRILNDLKALIEAY